MGKTFALLVALIIIVAGGWYASTFHMPMEEVESPLADEEEQSFVATHAHRQLSIGESADVDGLSLTLIEVTDSRCPLDVVCIQAGTVSAELALSTEYSSSTEILRQENGEFAFDEYFIVIEEATPYPQSTGEIVPEEYRITFGVGNTPDAVFMVRDELFRELSTTSEIVIQSFEERQWSDACLGVYEEGILCAQVITPGFQAMYRVDDMIYVYHMNRSGSNSVLAFSGTQEEFEHSVFHPGGEEHSHE